MEEKRVYRPVPEFDEDERIEVFVNGTPREQADALLDIAMRGQRGECPVQIVFWIGMFLRDPDITLRTSALIATRHLASRWPETNWDCIRRVLYDIANEDPEGCVRISAIDIIDDIEHTQWMTDEKSEES
ncbi:MAG: hypothetical protein JKX70_07390 [Phycisphaerales bacterium]|nr:hypothetical protein [Phycisphaerales bacterium]